MEMIVENYPSVDAQTFLPTTILQRAHEDIAARRCREDWEPLDNGRSDEMRGALIVDAIATAHAFGRMRNGVSSDKCVPKQSLGTRMGKGRDGSPSRPLWGRSHRRIVGRLCQTPSTGRSMVAFHRNALQEKGRPYATAACSCLCSCACCRRCSCAINAGADGV